METIEVGKLLALVKSWGKCQTAAYNCPDLGDRNPSVERADAFRLCIQDLMDVLAGSEVA